MTVRRRPKDGDNGKNAVVYAIVPLSERLEPSTLNLNLLEIEVAVTDGGTTTTYSDLPEGFVVTAVLSNGGYAYYNTDSAGIEYASVKAGDTLSIFLAVNGTQVAQRHLTVVMPEMVYRTSVWEAGKTYRNDTDGSKAADGLRYIDVVTDKDMAVIGTDTINGYVCRKTHTASASIPLAEGEYWQKMNALAPLSSPLILAKKIIASMIDVDSLAAAEAFIAALKVRRLETANATTKRIVINDSGNNRLEVYDDSNTLQAVVSGESIGKLADIVTESANTTRASGFYTLTPDVSLPSPSATFSFDTDDFTIASGRLFTLRQTTITIQLPVLTSKGNDDWGYITVGAALCDANGNVLAQLFSGQRATCDKNYKAVLTAAGSADYRATEETTCCLKITVTAQKGRSPVKTPAGASAGYSCAAGSVTADPAQRHTAIGKDGIRTMWGVNNYAFISTTEGIRLRLGGYGIDIKDNTLALRIGDTSYKVGTATATDTDGNTITTLQLTQ